MTVRWPWNMAPVREAMKLLCHEGLLTAHPRRGMTVTCLSDAQVTEAQQLCTLLGRQLTQLEAQAASPYANPAICTELTSKLHAVAQARLQLALGPRPLSVLRKPPVLPTAQREAPVTSASVASALTH